jgi:CRP-like cAMP-binding protein
MATMVVRPKKSAVRTAPGVEVRNKILLELPAGECNALLAKLEFLKLPVRTILNEASEPIRDVFFINDGLASVLTIMADGSSVEVGLCGSEGFVGLPLLAGFKSSPTQVIMQVGGSGFRMSAKDFGATLRSSPALVKDLNRFAQLQTLQATQIAACNRLHPVTQRLARWLLMSQDRLGGSVVALTQEFLAHMLATRRASVTVAASALQKKALISYRRGEVTILNRSALIAATCECYSKLVDQKRKWASESR